MLHKPFNSKDVLIIHFFQASILPSSLRSFHPFVLVENSLCGKELNLVRPPNSSDDILLSLLSLSFYYDHTQKTRMIIAVKYPALQDFLLSSLFPHTKDQFNFRNYCSSKNNLPMKY